MIAALDGAALGLPMDPIVATYVFQNRSRFLLYVLMASTGSALGSIVIYGIGYMGGEGLLRKRISPERFDKFHQAFQKHPFWSLMFPAMLPPPTPFKLFALAAAVSEMKFTHFLHGHLRRPLRALHGTGHPHLGIRSAIRAHLRKRFPAALGMGAGGGCSGIGSLASSNPREEKKKVGASAPLVQGLSRTTFAQRGGGSSAMSSWKQESELCSSRQPRAAVPTVGGDSRTSGAPVPILT